jgi:hypothetical protein
MSVGIDRLTTQSMTIDDFFYYFLQLRKPRIRFVVERLRKLHPEMTRDELAQRVVDSHARLSMIAGGLLNVPFTLPGVNVVLRYFGLAAGSAVITRMHLYLILEIALIYERDIDDPARVPEMMAVVGATEAAVTVPPVVLRWLGVAPLISIPASGLAATTLTRLLGRFAIRFYSQEPSAQLSGEPGVP